MNRFTITLLALASVGMSWAAQPRTSIRNVTQSDGKIIVVSLIGNGNIGFFKTSDDFALLRNQRGDLCYAIKQADSLTISSVIAHNVSDRNTNELDFIKKEAVSTSEAFQLSSKQTALSLTRSDFSTIGAYGLGTYGVSAAGSIASIGKPLIPIIMVQFPNKSFQKTTTQSVINNMFNQHNYNDNNGSVGSVRDFFVENSDSLFMPSFDIIDKVTVPQNYQYYGANSSTSASIDVHCSEIVADAINRAIDNNLIDLSKYANSSKHIPLIGIIYAGSGEHVIDNATAGVTDLIWAHFSDLRGVNVTQNKVTYSINSYLVSDEVWPNKNKDGSTSLTTAGIGVMTHEFGHALGLPDFYSTHSVENIKSMSFWSIMDSGEWWNNGYAPVGYNAYERSSLGWLKSIETLGSTPKACTLSPLGSGRGVEAYRITNSANPNEYYILENRQNFRWTPQNFGTGMLVSHVNYSSTSWANNNVNNIVGKEGMTIVPADGSIFPLYSSNFTYNDFKGDLYPGLKSNNELSTTSNPSILSYKYANGTINSIYNIVEDNEHIKFSYLDVSVGIDNISSVSADEMVKIFTVDGRYVVSCLASNVKNQNLESGLYVVSGKSTKYKLFKN